MKNSNDLSSVSNQLIDHEKLRKNIRRGKFRRFLTLTISFVLISILYFESDGAWFDLIQKEVARITKNLQTTPEPQVNNPPSAAINKKTLQEPSTVKSTSPKEEAAANSKETILKKPKVIHTPERSAFYEFSKSDRLLIHSGMKRFGHYNGQIDGLWGPRTNYAYKKAVSTLSISEQKLPAKVLFQRIRDNELRNRNSQPQQNNNQNFLNTLGQAYLLKQLMNNNQQPYIPPPPTPQLQNRHIRCTMSNGLSSYFRNNTYVNCY